MKFPHALAGRITRPLTPPQEAAVEAELGLLDKAGLTDHLLEHAALTDALRREGKLVHPSSGSLGGLVLGFALGITPYDALTWGLWSGRAIASMVGGSTIVSTVDRRCGAIYVVASTALVELQEHAARRGVSLPAWGGAPAHAIVQVAAYLASKLVVPVPVGPTAHDLAVLHTLNRPGPVDMGLPRLWSKACAQTHGANRLDQVLGPTRGCLVWREQCEALVRAALPLDLREAFEFSRHVFKHSIAGDPMAPDIGAHHEQWVAGCRAHGIDRHRADEVWGVLVRQGRRSDTGNQHLGDAEVLCWLAGAGLLETYLANERAEAEELANRLFPTTTP